MSVKKELEILIEKEADGHLDSCYPQQNWRFSSDPNVFNRHNGYINGATKWASMMEELLEFSRHWEYLSWGGDRKSGWHTDRNYNEQALSTSELLTKFIQSKNTTTNERD